MEKQSKVGDTEKGKLNQANKVPWGRLSGAFVHCVTNENCDDTKGDHDGTDDNEKN